MNKGEGDENPALRAIAPEVVVAQPCNWNAMARSLNSAATSLAAPIHIATGPNPGYGFGTDPTSDDIEQHPAEARGFLAMIDPEAGYFEEN